MRWNRLTGIDTGLGDVPNRRALHHIANRESLYCFVLGDCTRAIGAAHEADVATAFFISATISSLFGLRERTYSVIDIRASTLASTILYREFRYSTQLSGVHLPCEHVKKKATHHLKLAVVLRTL
jgi:hypothetical protein